MLNGLKILDTAMGLSRHATHQQAVVSRNFANIDTPGYAAKQLQKFDPRIMDFQILKRTRSMHLSGNKSLPQDLEKVDTSSEVKPNGNSVSLEAETLKSIEAERMHSRSMAIYQSSLNILRSSIGRGR